MNYQDIISNVEVYGLRESMVASGYPMLYEPYTHEEFVTACKDIVVDKDSRHLKRSKNLASTNIGEGHDNYLNGVIVQFDLKFTVKAWTEAERYHFFDFVSSQSTMHKITKFDFDEVYDSHVDSRIIDVVKEKVDAYNRMLKLTEHEDFKKLPENEQKEALADLADMYIDILMNNPAGCRLTARMTTNYRQLKTIYNQRKNHRLPEWREFC